MHILFLSGSHTSPAARFWLWQFVQPLQARGHTVKVRVIRPSRHWHSSLSCPVLRYAHSRVGKLARLASAMMILRDAECYDIIMMNRDVVPDSGITFIEPWLAQRNPRLIFDFDDAIHLGAREPKLRKILPHFA